MIKEIKEYKAPTDDSIRYYEELKEKAERNILSRVEVNNTEFMFEGFIVEDSPMSLTVRLYLKCRINNKDYYGCKEFNREELMEYRTKLNSRYFNEDAIIKYAREYIIELLADMFMVDIKSRWSIKFPKL